MVAKTEILIRQLSEVQDKINVMYKNIISIDGQYNAKLKTIATVLKLQACHRKDCYTNILMKASDKDIEITDDGFESVQTLLKQYKALLSKTVFDNEKNIIDYALQFSNANILMFTEVITLLEKYEKEKNIYHRPLKDSLNTIIEMENKDIIALKKFL